MMWQVLLNLCMQCTKTTPLMADSVADMDYYIQYLMDAQPMASNTANVVINITEKPYTSPATLTVILR